jgi:hypothetical protein
MTTNYSWESDILPSRTEVTSGANCYTLSHITERLMTGYVTFESLFFWN